MKYYKSMWAGRHTPLRSVETTSKGLVIGARPYNCIAVPTVDECALTTFFAFEAREGRWVSFLDSWDEYRNAILDDERAALVEISRLEVIILVGSTPKICGDDVMPVRSYDP